jgi:HAMP domain-containing protein
VRGRFVSIVAVVLGLVATTVFQYYPGQLEQSTRDAMDQHARDLARTVGIGVAVTLETLELGAISAALEFARSDADLRVVIARDADGNVIGEYRTDSLATVVEQDVLRVVEPIVYQGEILGEVELVMSLDAQRAAIAAQRRNGLLICAAIFIVGVLLTAAAARPITAPLADLAKAADAVALGNLDAPLPTPRDREVRRLAEAFEHMRGQVKDALHGLGEKSAEMSVMLDHLEQGVFTFNPDLTINREYSKRAPGILGVRDIPAATWDELLPVDSATLAAFRQWVDLMAGPRGVRNVERFARLNPVPEFMRTTEDGLRYVTFTCRPIVRDDRVWRFLVLVTDVTEQRRARTLLEAKGLAQQRESERIVALVRSDRSEGEDLRERCQELLTSLRASTLDDLLQTRGASVKREVHTLKGDTGSFGFSALCEALAGVEEHLFPGEAGASDAERSEAWAAALAALAAESRAIEEWRARLFSERGDRLSVDAEAYKTFVVDVASGALVDPAAILERLRYLPARRLRDICRRYQYVVDTYRRTHGKQLADLHIATPDVRILPHLMRAVDSSLVQLLRNAVDHGIESDEERTAAGKGPGRVTIEARYVHDALELTVADDGRGIDEAAVVAAAIRSGVVTPEQAERLSTEERVRLVLRSGVTTRAVAGDISGRGVGLDAVADELRVWHGTVRIASNAGRGSAMTLRVPTVEDASQGNGRGG